MTGFERRLVLRTWRILLPLPEGVAWPEAHARRFLDAFAAEAPWLGRQVFRAALWLVTLSPVIVGRWPWFPRLDPVRAEALAERLYRSRIYLVRQGMMLLRLQGSMAVLGDLEVQRALGLRDLPWVPRGQRQQPTRAEELAAHGIAPERGGVGVP